MPEQREFGFEEPEPSKSRKPGNAGKGEVIRIPKSEDPDCNICGMPQSSCPHYGNKGKKMRKEKPWEKHLK